MGEWIGIKFREAGRIQGGYAFSSTSYRDGGIPLTRISNVGKGRYSNKDVVYLPESFLEKYSTFSLTEGNVIMGLTGDLEKVCRVKKENIPTLLNQRVGRILLINDENSEDFFYYLMSSNEFQNKLSVFFEGGAQANISPKQIESLSICIPASKSEQKTIATILTTIDQAIEKTEQLIAKYERIKIGLMQDLLTCGMDELGNIRSEETHEFKDSPLGRIPVEWEYYNLQECCDTIITYGIVQAGEHLEDGVPYIRTGDMSGDFLQKKGLLFTAEKIAKKFERSKVEVGDIVFALRATVGKVLPVPIELSGANLTQGTAKISPKESINEKFILWMLRSDNIVCQIRLVIKGTTFAEISLGNLRKVIVGVPKNKVEQDKIATMLEDINNFIISQKLNLDKLTHQKIALMQDLLSGKIRVDNLINQKQNIPQNG
jgi:type I restriction enzyme S subunit